MMLKAEGRSPAKGKVLTVNRVPAGGNSTIPEIGETRLCFFEREHSDV
jgi:hypothetical protein